MSKISLKHSGGNVVSLNSPTSAPTSADVAFKLPNADGTSGQAIVTDGSGNLSFAGTGKILQVVQEAKTDQISASVGASPTLSTDLISKAITPSATSSKILVRANLIVGISDDKQVFTQLFKDGSAIAGAKGITGTSRQMISGGVYITSAGRIGMITHEFLDSPNTTSSVTYSYRFSHDSNSSKTIYLNKDHTNSDNSNYTRGFSSITLMEVAA